MRRDSVATYQVQHQRGPEHQLKKVGDKTAFDQRNFLTMAVDYLLRPMAAFRPAAKSLCWNKSGEVRRYAIKIIA